jgi:hypothetical protein
MAKVTFKFGGGSIPVGKESQFVRRMKEALDKSPYGQFYNNLEIARLTGYSDLHVKSNGNMPELQDYREPMMMENERTGKSVLMIEWGSKKTIAAYRKENPK